MQIPNLPLSDRKPALIIGGIVVVGAIATTSYALLKPKEALFEPTYSVILPQRTPIEDLGGWQRVNPDDKDPVFAYSDSIKSVDISVSQQPLPADFIGNVANRVKQVAEGFSATTIIEAGGTQVYIGRNARGPQSVIFAKNDVLVFIKSEKTIDQENWVRYINNLVDPKTEKTPTF